MSIRLDPRRVGTLKQLAGDRGVRPGDLVRQWVEERIDAERRGVGTPAAAESLVTRLDELAARVAALEASASDGSAQGPEDGPATASNEAMERPTSQTADDVEPAPSEPELEAASRHDTDTTKAGPERRRVTAAPSGERVALHDEMIAVLRERGPMSAGELAEAVAERGRYSPPRSGKPIDAAMISQRVSNPTYRARFTRNEGRIGLAE